RSGPFAPKAARRPTPAEAHAVSASPGALDARLAWRRERQATNRPPTTTTWRGRGIGRRGTSALLDLVLIELAIHAHCFCDEQKVRGRYLDISEAKCGAPASLYVVRPSRDGLERCGAAQSMNVHVSAPSKWRTCTDCRRRGSKLLRLTPCLLPGCGTSGSQCVRHPQVLQRKLRSVLSPQMYSAVFSGCPSTRTVPNS